MKRPRAAKYTRRRPRQFRPRPTGAQRNETLPQPGFDRMLDSLPDALNALFENGPPARLPPPSAKGCQAVGVPSLFEQGGCPFGGGDVRILVLGPVELHGSGRALPLGTPKQKTALALLLAGAEWLFYCWKRGQA